VYKRYIVTAFTLL